MSENTTATATATEKPKVKVTVSEVKKMLENGQDRKAIGEHFGLSWTQTQLLFKNKHLKGLKVHRAIDPNFELVDDIIDAPATSAPASDAPATSESTANGEASAAGTDTNATAEQAPAETTVEVGTEAGAATGAEVAAVAQPNW